MKYQKFIYLFPPRPEVKTKASELANYDSSGEYIAQPKYNGSCCLVFTNGSELKVYNRHKELLTNVSPNINFKELAKSKKWFVYAGEYLNKGKLGENGEKEVGKFVIWDLLVWDGEYLIGSTLKERLDLLEQIYPCNRAVISDKIELYEHLCCTEIPNIYKAPTYVNGFESLYSEIVKIDLYEGLVLKKINSKLSYGLQELNNTDWQIKCRKETKLYNF
mgnify:FL=1